MHRLIIALALILGGPAAALDFWPGAEYDPATPTFEAVLGHAPGERITPHAQVLRYFEALARAHPDRLHVEEYARSWEGRALIFAAIGAPERIAALPEFAAAMQALAEPVTTGEARSRALIQSTPASVWLAYAVHGNEISSTEAAMLTAYHLLAARNDPLVEQVLAESLVFLDPLQNPDGRDRFVHHFEMARGLEPDPDRHSAEHDEPWPTGRVNHYTFDLNRDWLPLTQPETRGRVAALQRFYPLVVVDAHEMSGDSTYYFAPEAPPYNPHIVASQRSALELIGRNNARWFDRYGIDYFTREVYDAFYPGYGASWPLYYGAVATTYEQASVRGLVLRQADGDTLRFAESVRNHFVTSLATAETVATNRHRLLQDFVAYRASAIAAGGRRAWVIDARPDPSAADKLAAVLVEHGLTVNRARSPFEACGENFPAGSYVVPSAQGPHYLARNLLDPQVDMAEAFLARQEERRARRLDDEIYDVTAWSLPLMYGVAVSRCSRAPTGDFEPAGPERIRPGSVTGADAEVAFLVPWGTRAAGRFLAAALHQGLRVRSSQEPFRLDGRDFPAGTLIIKVPDHDASLPRRLNGLARQTGAEVIGVSDSWASAGPNFGSRNVVELPAPRVALVWDRPAGRYSAGHARFVLERQFGYPVTAIRGRTLAAADLSRYQVLILPAEGAAGEYATVLGESGLAAVREWVEEGGTLVLLDDAVAWAADPEVNLVALRRETAWEAEEETMVPEAEPETVPGTRIESSEDYAERIEPEQAPPDSVPGALLRARVDSEHWLALGVPGTVNVLYRGRDIYQPLALDLGRNVVRFEAAEALLAGGYLWAENREQLAFKPFATVEERGKGTVVAFTQDPNYRAYLDGLNLLFLNAVFRGPAQARVVR